MRVETNEANHMRVLFQTLVSPCDLQAVVRGRNEYGEYVVRVYSGEKHLKGADSFETDLDAAIGTAIASVFG